MEYAWNMHGVCTAYAWNTNLLCIEKSGNTGKSLRGQPGYHAVADKHHAGITQGITHGHREILIPKALPQYVWDIDMHHLPLVLQTNEN